MHSEADLAHRGSSGAAYGCRKDGSRFRLPSDAVPLLYGTLRQSQRLL